MTYVWRGSHNGKNVGQHSLRGNAAVDLEQLPSRVGDGQVQ